MTAKPDEPDAAQLAALRARAKQEIRRQLRATRRVLPESACAERSARACASLQALPELASVRTVIAYVAMRKEIDPRALCDALRACGVTVGLPRIEDEGLELHVHAGEDALIENEMGVREPAPDAPRIELAAVDVIVVPALALDPRGYRIGYGGGYYDRLLPALPHAFKIGFAYDFQLVAEAPNDAHDVPVDCIVTDARVLRAER
ncbi:MAG TPA: 5-formyltetrahydrofolate cyclo-ligase [Polyangiales bacterium]|nr:5-formyltetrahydrofolate cyclo-ligase [Polyangiales bacterium]